MQKLKFQKFMILKLLEDIIMIKYKSDGKTIYYPSKFEDYKFYLIEEINLKDFIF